MVRLSSVTLALFATSVSAQIIPSNGLPACVQQCTPFIQAQATCVTNPPAQDSCFCQSTLLQPLRSAPNNNQCPTCSQADWQSIVSWYNGKCANGGVGASSTTLGTVVSTTAGAAPASSTGALKGTGGPAGTQEPSASGSSANAAATGFTTNSNTQAQSNPADYKNGQEWWEGHWRWIVMLIVLLVAFTILGVVGTILYRRRQRRLNTAGTSGPAGSWGPNNSAHDFDTHGRQALAAAPPPKDEKSTGTRKTRTLTRKLVGR